MTDRLDQGPDAVAPLAAAAPVGTLATPVVESEPAHPGTPAPLEQPEREFTVKARSQRQMVRRRFMRHRLAMICLVVLTLVVLLAFVGGALWRYSYDQAGTVVDRGRPTLDLIPGLDGDGVKLGDHPFGQDDVGRDYFALTLRGAQRSIIIAAIVGLLSTFVGTLVGALAGFYRGWVDNALMRFVDVALTLPLLLIAAVLGRRYGGSGILALAITISLASWLSLSRVVRGEFLSLREKEYVEAARALGTANRRIIFKHMLPNVAGTIIVNATLAISAGILIETALSFLGLGVRAPDTSLGVLVSQYQNAFTTRPWLFWWPGLFIVIVALCVNFVGDGLRDAFDPRQTRVRA